MEMPKGWNIREGFQVCLVHQYGDNGDVAQESTTP